MVNQSSGAAGVNKATGAVGAQTGNASMQLAWNTTGFLPTTITSQGQKPNSVKDFEYLKFVNDTILKDEVLDRFMQKAGEIEIAAGPQSRSRSPNKKQQPRTPLEKMQVEFQKNPHGMHTCTRFDRFFSKESSPIRKRLSKDVRANDLDNQIHLQPQDASKEESTVVSNSQQQPQRHSRERHVNFTKSFTNNSRESVTIPTSKRYQKLGSVQHAKPGEQLKEVGENSCLNERKSSIAAQKSKNALPVEKITTSHRDRENLVKRMNKPKTAYVKSERPQRCNTTSTNSARGPRKEENSNESGANNCYFNGITNQNSHERLPKQKKDQQNQQRHLSRQRSKQTLNKKAAKLQAPQNVLSAEEERKRVVEENEAYAKNVRQQQDIREAQQEQNGEYNRYQTFQNGLKSYNASVLNSQRNKRNTSKSGQTTVKAAEDLNTAVQDLIKVSKKYKRDEEEQQRYAGINNNKERILCASPPYQEKEKEIENNLNEKQKQAKISKLPTPNYGKKGERNSSNQATCFQNLSENLANKAYDVYASYDATRFATHKIKSKLDIEPHLVTESDVIQQQIFIKNQSDDQLVNHLQTEHNTTDFGRNNEVTDKSVISRHGNHKNKKSQSSSLPDLTLNPSKDEENYRRRNQPGISSPIATAPATIAPEVAKHSPKQLITKQRKASLESNCSSIVDSHNKSAMRIVAGRMSYGAGIAGMGIDAKSFGTTDQVDSRTNLSNDKELKRIYHRKMQIIGRDSNGALLSKQELTDLKINQAKQVAKSVMANEKRKLQIMSKLKPVLNNASKESIEDNQNPTTQNSGAIPLIIQKSCNERSTLHKKERAISPINQVIQKTSEKHTMIKGVGDQSRGLPEVGQTTQSNSNMKTSLDRMLNRLSQKQQQQQSIIGTSDKPSSFSFKQPTTVTAAEESVSGENYNRGLRQYLGSRQKNRSSHKTNNISTSVKGTGIMGAVAQPQNQSSSPPSTSVAASEILAVSTSCANQNKQQQPTAGGQVGNHRTNSICNAAATGNKTSSLATSVIKHRPSAPITSKVTYNQVNPMVTSEGTEVYSNIVAKDHFSKNQSTNLPIDKQQHKSGSSSKQRGGRGSIMRDMSSQLQGDNVQVEDRGRFTISRSAQRQKQAVTTTTGGVGAGQNKQGIRNQANAAIYSNKMVIIRSNSRISDSASSSTKKLKVQHQIVQNIMNDEQLRRIEKVQEAYSGEVVTNLVGDNQANRLIYVNKNGGKNSSSSKKLFQQTKAQQYKSPQDVNLINVLTQDKNQMSPSVSKANLHQRAEQKPEIAISVNSNQINKPRQTWQESMSQHWKTVGQNSLDRSAAAGSANSPTRNQISTKRKLNQKFQSHHQHQDHQQQQSKQLAKQSVAAASVTNAQNSLQQNQNKKTPPPYLKRNNQKSLAAVAKASSLIAVESMKEHDSRDQPQQFIRTSNLLGSTQQVAKRYDSTHVQRSGQGNYKQSQQNYRLVAASTTTSKSGSKMHQRKKVQLEASIAEQQLANSKQNNKHYLENASIKNNQNSPKSSLLTNSAQIQRRQFKSKITSTKNGAHRRLVTIRDQEDIEMVKNKVVDSSEVAEGNDNFSPSHLYPPIDHILPQKNARMADKKETTTESVDCSMGGVALTVDRQRPKPRRPSFLDNVLMRPHSQIDRQFDDKDQPFAAGIMIPKAIEALSPQSRQQPQYNAYNSMLTGGLEALRAKANTQLRMAGAGDVGLSSAANQNLLLLQHNQTQNETDTAVSLEEQLQQSSIMAMQTTFQIGGPSADRFSSVTGGAATSFKMMLGYSNAGKGGSSN